MRWSEIIRVGLRNTWSSIGSVALVATSIALGVSFIAGSLIFSATLNRSFESLADRLAVGVDVEIVSASEEMGVPLEMGAELAAAPGVARVVPEVFGGISLLDSDGEVIGTKGAPVLAIGYLPADQSLDPEPLNIVAGRAPESPGEMLINEGAARQYGLRFDAETPATTRVSAPFLLSPRNFKVVGVYRTPSDAGGYVGAYVTASDAVNMFVAPEDRGGRSHFAVSAVAIVAHPGTDLTRLSHEIDALVNGAKVRDGAPPEYDVRTGAQVRQDFVDEARGSARFVTYFVAAFGLIGLIGGAAIILNVFGSYVVSRRREFALLRIVGLSGRGIGALVLLEAVIVGLLGSTVGLGLGIAFAVGMRSFVNWFSGGFPDSGLAISPPSLLLAFAVGVAAAAIAGIVPAAAAGRIPPIVALQNPAGVAVKHSQKRLAAMMFGALVMSLGLGLWLTIAGSSGLDTSGLVALAGLSAVCVSVGLVVLMPSLWSWALSAIAPLIDRFGVSASIARVSAARATRRSVSAAATIMLATSLIVGTAVLGRSMTDSIASGYAKSLVADYVLTPSVAPTQLPLPSAEMPRTFLTDLRAAAGAEQLVAQYPMSVVTQDPGDATRIEGFAFDGPVTEALSVDLVSGALWTATPAGHATASQTTIGQVIVDEATATRSDLAVGDNWLLGPDGGFGQLTVSATVVGIYKPVAGSPLTGILTSTDFLQTLYPEALGLVSPVAIYVTDTASSPGLGDRLRELARSAVSVRVQTTPEIVADAQDQARGLVAVLYALIGLAALIGLLAVATTLSLSVAERSRELSLLRLIGMNRGQLTLSVLCEALLVSAFGVLLGIFAGITGASALISALREQGLSVVAIPWPTLGAISLGLVAAGVSAASRAAVRAGRADPLDASASE